MIYSLEPVAEAVAAMVVEVVAATPLYVVSAGLVAASVPAAATS